MEKKKVVLYCRAAVYDQENKALDMQEEALRKYAQTQNYKIIKTVKEFCGGTDLNRPWINRIYEIVDSYKVDAVIAKNVSRYGRCSPEKISDFIESLQEKGVEVLTLMNWNLKYVLPVLTCMNF